MIPFSNSCVVTATLSFLLGTFVFWKGVRKPTNILWGLFCFSVSLWSLGLGMMVRANSMADAILWLRSVHYLGAIMIPIFFFHFVVVYLGRSDFKKILRRGYITAAGLQASSLFGYMASVEPLYPFNFYTIPFPSYALFVVYFFYFVAYSHWLLFLQLKQSQGQVRNQIQYMFWGTFVGFCGGSTAFLPVFHLPIFPYGVYGVFVYVLSVSYAILKHRLMDIALVIRKTLIYSAVMAVLTIFYVVIISVLARLFDGLAGYQTLFSPALAAVLITVGFQPLRKRAQAFVDAKFFRQYVDREEKLYELSREVITHTTPEAMANALIHVLRETLHPKCGVVYLRGREGSGYFQTASLGTGNLAAKVSPEDPLPRYFTDHPQPFVQDPTEDMGESRNTRRVEHKERNTD